MTRPIDETWSCDGGCIDMDAPSVVHRIGSFGQSSAVQAETDRNEARARLAAQAPAMARLLVDLEWGADICIGYDNITALGCPSCGGLQHDPGNRADFDHQTVGHDPDCELVAVLRAAGVVE